MLLLTVGLAGVLQAIASVPASATSNCTSTTFSDDFTTDTSLSGCWQTGTALISTVASDFGEADNSPVLNFGNYDETEPSNYMDMSGADNTDTFTAIQSANAYAAPFQFAATVNVANVDRGDTWAIYLVNPSRPSEAFSVETDTNSSDAPPFSDPPNSDTYGMWANNGLGTTTSNTALLSPNTPTDATYDIAMSIDTYGYGSVSVNGGPQISVGYIGLGSFDVLLGQRELNTLIPGGQDGGWFSAGLTPNYCSAYNFSDDFANDGSLNASCWQAATAATVGSYTALNDLNSNYVHATYESPSLAFSSGMQMTGLTGTPQWTGIQSAQTYSPPFQLTTSVTGNSLAADDFSIYVTDAKGATAKTFAVEGDFLNQTSSACPGNSVEGLWAADSAPAGWCEGSTPILSSLAAGTTYDITMAVNANGTDSVSVNGGPPVEVNGGQSLGSGPFYVVLAQRESTNQYDGPIGEGLPLEATWGSVSLQPSVATTLAVNPGSVGSVESVPESSVAATSVGSSSSTAGDTASAPLDSIPLDSIPLDSIAAPGAGAPPALVAAETALSSTLLSDISIKYSSTCGGAACAGWAAILYGTPFANVPLESVTLADVLNNATANTAFGNVSLADLDLSNTPLGSIPLASVELGPTPLSDISLPGAQGGTTPLQAWCTELASLHSSCADFGMSPTNDNGVTLLSLALAGVPLDSIPLDSIPLDSIPLDSIPLDSIPLDSIPLDSIQLASSPLDSIPLDSIPLDSIPLDSIPLDSIPLDSIGTLVNCLGSVSCTTGTLGEAYAAGVLQPSATIGELVGALPAGDFAGTSLAQLLVGDNSSVAGYPSITLGDVLLATEPPASYPWQSVSLPSLPVARPPEVTFTYSYTFGQPVNFNLQAALPSGFSYVPGSTTESGEGSIPDPIVSGSTLIFGQQDESAPFYPFTGTITFKATPGLDIGPQATTMSDTVVDGSQNAIDSSTAASALNVVDSEDPTIDTPGDSIVLPTGTVSLPGDLNVGYLRSQGDVNDWQVTVSQGDELSLALTNLPATYDLEVFGPNGQSLSPTPPTEAVPGVSDTLPSVTPSSNTEGTPGSEDLQITPPEGYSRLLAISNNPDAQSQYIQTPPLAAGEYMVQISGYNGAFSTQPYLLQANLLGGGTTPTCPGIAYPNTLADPSTGPPATLAIPSGAATVTPAGATNVSGTLNTLFLVDTQRLTAAFGATAETNIMNDIQADATTTGVVGAIVPVDAWASVQSAYSIWNPDPCSVIGGNDVVSAISSVVDSIEATYPSVQNVVIVGADDQIPFARIADGTTQSNERDYGQSTFEGQDNVEGDALSLGYYFSDDPYAASEPLGVGSATLYSPQLAVGRLVESAGEIEGALTRFSSTGGNLDASASLTTGYSFLTSGAQAVSANLAGNGLTASDLINEDWQAGDLDSALTATNPTPGVDSINAHFDYSRGLPAYGNTTGNDSNLFTTTDIRNSVSTYAGRLLFSMGCHAGLDVDDAEVETSLSAAPVDDWAKAFADAGALWVANTGFGYADTDTIAYSAKLMTGFAANLNGSLTIGEALTEAKQQYEAGNAILSPYDLKALMESTLYGLPMYTLNGSSGTAPSVPSGPPTGTDPVTGMTVAPVSLNLGSGSSALPGQLSLVTTPNGDYYQVNGSTSGSDGTQATEYRPIEPLVSLPVTEAGLVPHGAIVTGLSSTDTPFTPAISMPAVGSSDSTPPTIDDAAFPGTLQRVAGYSTFTSTGTGQGATLDLVAGQFFPNPSSPGSGTERLFNTMSAEVYYDQPGSRYASDYTPATIDFTQAVTTGSDVNFAVQVTAGGAPVTRVLVLYTDAAHPGAWTAVDLSSSDGQNWSGASPSASSGVQYLVEAVDAAGNVAVSNNEGTAFDSTPQPSTSTPAISIALSGNGPTNGYYTGAVTATVTAPSGSTYVVDDSQVPQPVPAGGTVTVTGAGPHEISVTDPSGHTSSQGFAIASAFTSSSGTTTALSSSAGSVPAGGSVTLTATVTAESPSAGTPTGNVEFLDGTNPINGCADEPLSGAVATCNATGLSTGPHQVTAEYLAAGEFASSTANPVDVVVLQAAPFTITVNAGSSAAVAPGTPATLAESGLPLLATGTVTFYTNNGTELCSFSFGTSTSCPTSASLTSQTDSGIYSTFADTDGSYASSKSTNTVSLTVSAATQFSITVNGSSSAAAIAFGSSATLAESGLPSTATGPVSFTSGSTTLCSFVLSSTTTNCSTSSGLPATTYSNIRASFTDTDGVYEGSTSTNSVSLSVTPASTTFAITVNGSAAASINYGGTAILAESGLPPGSTGTVTFFTSGGTMLCSFVLSNTTTSCPTSPSLAVKTYSGITAGFTDTDGNHAGSTATNTVSLTVNKAATAFTITVNGSSSSASITYGGSATLAESGLPSTATGTVAFTSGSTPLCSFVLSTTTTSCATPSSLAVKTYSGITAGFTDTDGNHTGSTATNTVSLTVNKAATAFTIFVNGSSSASVTYGSTAILAESGLPAGATGLVTFFTSGGIPLCAFIYGFLPGGTTTSCNVWPNLPVAAYSGIYATFIDLDGNYLSSKAPNTVALTVTKATPKVTWPAPAPITYGTRLGGSQLDATASVPGTFSYSPAAATVLQPGTQTLSVTFSPMDATDYSSATASTTILVGFTQACLTTTDNGSLAVSKGQAICIGPGGRVTGSVSVASGGALWVSAGTIGGSLGSTGALAVTVCGTKVTGSVSVAGSSGPVILGGSGCAADTLGGSVNVTGSTAGVLFDSSTVTGSLTISNNSAGVTVSGNDVTGSAAVSSNSGGVTFTNNTVWGSLAITYNTGPFAYSGNVVHGSTTNKGNT